MKLKTGIFGGSFNPIHIGHLALANYLCEFEGLDELWFMVTPQNPLKQETELLDDETRLHLVKSATQGYPKFKASDFEFHLPKPSYTIDTLDELRKAFPEREFYLIIGADNWSIFNKWKDHQRILDESQLFIYPRKGYEIEENKLPANVRLVKAPEMEISSTFIREAIKQGKDIRYFLPPYVYDEISRIL